MILSHKQIEEIAVAVRLSLADEDTGYGSKAESDSIGNQRMLINRYLDNHPVLSKYPRFEFADVPVIIGLKQNPTQTGAALVLFSLFTGIFDTFR